MRHLADVAALKHDLPAQRQVLIDGLNTLFGTTFGWWMAADDWRTGRRPTPVMGVPTGTMDPVFQRYIADFTVRIQPEDDPYAVPSLASDTVVQQWIRHRVLPDLSAMRRFSSAVEVMSDAGMGDGAVGMFRIGPGGDRVVAFSLHRTRDQRPMTAREYALQHLAVQELHGLYVRGHLPMTPPPAELPPRLRQVLDRLLLGQSPKAIARGLGLSIWTIREYIQNLYIRQAVSGRDELMAKFVKNPASKRPA